MLYYISHGGVIMLSYLELKNYKSFSDIKLDLRKPYGVPKKIVFIYGENGSGKTNLLSSILFLMQSTNTLENQIKLKRIAEIKKNVLDSIKDEVLQQKILQQMLRLQVFSLSQLIEDYKMLATDKPMSLKFGFRLDGSDGSYYMEFSDSNIVNEELRYKINEREGIFFSLSKNKTYLSPTIFSNTNYRKELQDNIDKYWGNHTFLSILFSDIQSKNPKYIEERLSSNIMTVISWLRKFSIWCKQCSHETMQISIPYKCMSDLEKGYVKDSNDKELKQFENALNTFFTQLYSDIKAVYYVFTPVDDKFSYELCFRKQIDGSLIDVPISLESTGTLKLLEIFPVLFAGVAGASVFIDEIDSGIHDLLMKNILEHLDDSLTGQFIATTHNTLLMESLSPENTYIIRIDSKGHKKIDCVADYKVRTQKTNSIRSKYLRGDYDGIPFTGYFDFKELVDDVIDKMQLSSETKDGDYE